MHTVILTDVNSRWYIEPIWNIPDVIFLAKEAGVRANFELCLPGRIVFLPIAGRVTTWQM
ncbi:MAG: hypothetical protein JWO80_3417 [Bryobacterales bacterium]|nr:hypothetical protein [Bryobacterales bacterium]